MPSLSKRKLHTRNLVNSKERNSNGTFDIKKSKELNDSSLKWTDGASLEKQKRGKYMKGKTPNSTYYDKYGPSGTFTKAAEGSQKITDFFQSKESENLPEFLKNELTDGKNNMAFSEYNKKHAIFEYLKRLNNGKRKINSSLEAAQIVFIDPAPCKSRTVRYWASYWLSNKSIPISKQGKHKKIIRLIDDEDIAEKSHLWIRSQGGTTTPTKFKEFIEQNLLLDTGTTKKSMSITTASRWLNVLGYTFKQNPKFIDGFCKLLNSENGISLEMIGVNLTA
ncbi:12669_t:CDS:2 [Entrophospora sp. SA101]|nr:12669_t:CDS:2 [Entrophospora sp. SA101]